MKRGNLEEGIQFIFVKQITGIGEDKVLWHNGRKKKMKFKVSDQFIFAIRRYSHVHGFTDDFKITGYTTFKVNINASNN